MYSVVPGKQNCYYRSCSRALYVFYGLWSLMSNDKVMYSVVKCHYVINSTYWLSIVTKFTNIIYRSYINQNKIFLIEAFNIVLVSCNWCLITWHDKIYVELCFDKLLRAFYSNICLRINLLSYCLNMTTAARPTFDPARGGQGRGEKDLSAISRQYSSRDLPGHTKLKYR